MTTGEMIVAVVLAVLGSSALTVVITSWFGRHKDAAIVVRTEAETKDLMTQVWERSMKNMATQMELQQKRLFNMERKLEQAYATIDALNDKICDLESRLGERRSDDVHKHSRRDDRKE